MTTSMGFFDGMFAGPLQPRHGGRSMDWTKAAKLIAEHHPVRVVAGLNGDFECTESTIYENGEPCAEPDGAYYGSSPWATPTVVMYGEGGTITEIPCYTKTHVDPHIWWPADALAVLRPKARKPAKKTRRAKGKVSK